MRIVNTPVSMPKTRGNTAVWVLVLVALTLSHVAAHAQPEQRLDTSLRAAMPEKPFDVEIGVRIDQIVTIDQKSENFEVVANLRLEWDDPALAFDEREFGRAFKVFTTQAFAKFVDEQGLFGPAFVIHNQQGRRFTQEALVTVFKDGHAVYGERFTARLQAPEFDFVQYPFDAQLFFVHVDAIWPTEFMRFKLLEEWSLLGDQLGEEEWIFEKHWADVSEIKGFTDKRTSRFSFGFEAIRHLNYYWLRLFLPLGIIILVSWVTFFLQDFSKRVDIAGGNLLIFVAFNFTISGDLPKLGYVTFIDAIVFATFVFAGLVVVANVIFKRMESFGHEGLARRIDNYTIWIYPVTLFALVLLCWYWFVVQKLHV